MPACLPSHCSNERQVLKDRDQVQINNCRTIEPKLKPVAVQTPNGSTDIKTQQLEMTEIIAANRSTAVDFSTGHNDANGSEKSSVHNQNNKINPTDDDNLLPDQTVITNEV